MLLIHKRISRAVVSGGAFAVRYCIPDPLFYTHIHEVTQTVSIGSMFNPVPILIGAFGAFCLEVWRRKISSPTRPWITCVVDALCAIPYALRIGPWGKPNDIRSALKAAYARLKLPYPSKGFSENDTAYIARYEVARKLGLERSKAQYTPFGYYISTEIMTRRCMVKLQMQEYLKKHPSIESIPIKNPIFVIGFPRTGTTFLHELLGLHPSVRMHYTWEQQDPVPRTDDESLEAQTRDREAKYISNRSYFDTSLKLAGDAIQRIHRIKYDEPEECTTPCAMELPWAVSEIPWIPFAAKEVIALGAGSTFQTYRKFLQMLMWQKTERFTGAKYPTWMLKCPFHLPYLTELVAEFPDATVVWTHRNPKECIASACSLYEAILHMATEEPSVDRLALGKAVLEYTRISLDKAEETFKLLGDKFKPVHIRYADNVKNPKEICKRIVEQAGLEFSAEYEKRMDAYLAKSKAEREALKANTAVADKSSKKGSAELHDYSLEDYGLSEKMVDEIFADYIAKYDLASPAKKK